MLVEEERRVVADGKIAVCEKLIDPLSSPRPSDFSSLGMPNVALCSVLVETIGGESCCMVWWTWPTHIGMQVLIGKEAKTQRWLEHLKSCGTFSRH